MQDYLARRLLYEVPTVLATTALVFIAMRIMPGDILAAMLGEEGAGLLSAADTTLVQSAEEEALAESSQWRMYLLAVLAQGH